MIMSTNKKPGRPRLQPEEVLMRFLGQISGAKHEVMVEIARELTQARIYISPNEIMNRSYYESPPAIPRNIDIRALTRKLKNRVNKRNSRTHTQSSHEYSFTLSEGTRASLTRLSKRLNKNSSETISNLIDRAEKHQQLLSSEVFTTKKAKKSIERRALSDTWNFLYLELWRISKYEHLNKLSAREPSIEELKEIQRSFEDSVNKIKSKLIDQRLAKLIPDIPDFGKSYSKSSSND